MNCPASQLPLLNLDTFHSHQALQYCYIHQEALRFILLVYILMAQQE